MLKHLLRFKSVNKLLQQYQTKSLLIQNAAKTVTYSRSYVTKEVKELKKSAEPANDHAAKTHEQTPNAKQYSNPFTRDTPDLEQQPLAELQISDDERERRLKVLQLEVDIANQEGRRVPNLSFFQDHHWEQVLKLPTKSSRSKYYAYLWQIEMKKESKERKKLERAESTLQRKEDMQKEREENTHIIYGLGHTSLFLRIYDSSINHWQNNRLTRAMQFAPKMVLDCSYDQHMTKREAVNAAKQLMLTFAENRANDEPFDLHYCNTDLSSTCMQTLKKFIPTMLNPEFPMNVHQQCFTKIFPKENLVYLTPHCRSELSVYNPDDVYIIGAMVDTVNNEPLSLAKAKKMGLRMARLPLDRYLQWGSGSGKSLTLNQMVNIMLDLKKTGDWQKSLSHVPRRKIVNSEAAFKFVNKRAERLNVRIDRIMDDHNDYENNDAGFSNKSNPFSTKKVRTRRDDMQFDLATWGSKKKNTNM